uniref:Uncharacterized protein n=1 Tax=Setaria italica TaxID=4555 RepID=K3Z154_SETIT
MLASNACSSYNFCSLVSGLTPLSTNHYGHIQIAGTPASPVPLKHADRWTPGPELSAM